MPTVQPDFWNSVIASAKVFPLTGTGDPTVTVPAGARFVCFHVYLYATTTLTNITVKSGTTAISGAMPLAGDASFEFKNNGIPVFIGRETGEDLVFDQSGTSQLDGFAVVAMTSSAAVVTA